MHPLARLMISNRASPARRFEVVATADRAEVFLYDFIAADAEEAAWMGGVAPEAFVKALRSISAPAIDLRINSPGGSVFGGRAIEQALRDHPANITAHIDGLAASAASFVAMGADQVVMGQGAMMMVHKAWTFAYGNANDLRATASLLEKIDGTLVQTYAKKTGANPEDVAAWMAAETWFTAQEAVDAKLADSIAEDAPQARVGWDLSAFAKAPRLEPQSAAEQTTEPEPQRVDAAALLRRLSAAALPA